MIKLFCQFVVIFVIVWLGTIMNQDGKKATGLRDMPKTFNSEVLTESQLHAFYYGDTMAIRMGDKWDSPLKNLFEECIVPLSKNAHLLLGHRGCGKSTELCNLKTKFEADGLPVEIIDYVENVDVYDTSCWDVMLLITEGLCKIADRKNVPLSNKTLKAVFDYLTKDVEITESTQKMATNTIKADVDVGLPFLKHLLNVFAAFKNEMMINKITHTTMSQKMEKRASEWIGYINEISDTIASKLSGKQPILIFDNFEKIQPPQKIFDVLEYSILAGMPFPIIYTFPISLNYDARYVSIKNFYKPHTLPMIKVCNIDKSENQEGINVIKSIVELRADFSLFDVDALDLLIKQTGGVLRDLFNCIITASRRASRRGATKIEHEDALRALLGLSSDLARLISQSDYHMLANIYNDQKYRQKIEDKEFLLNKMQAMVILEYNGRRWHYLHPLIAQFLEEQGVVKNSSG
ncbi:MAG: hypothetical protein FWH37_02005 [Candidatus Bathyarchaeota archaeon]|nr:hypothetical protein [Candidatus Termiticorpusculum sp.]